MTTLGIVDRLADAKMTKEQCQGDEIGDGTRDVGAGGNPRNGQIKHLYTSSASIGRDVGGLY